MSSETTHCFIISVFSEEYAYLLQFILAPNHYSEAFWSDLYLLGQNKSNMFNFCPFTEVLNTKFCLGAFKSKMWLNILCQYFMCFLVVVFIFEFFQASLYTFYAIRAQMVTAKKLFSIQVCMCSIEAVFFKVACWKEALCSWTVRTLVLFFFLGGISCLITAVGSVGPKVSQVLGWGRPEASEETGLRVCWKAQKAM